MNKTFAPIVLFLYNRPDHTKKTLEALKNNELSDESILYIYCDGPKGTSTEKQLEKIKQTRLIAHEQKWCKEVNIIESDINKGLATSIIDGVTKIVNEYGKVIVLEDDLVTSSDFLTYMNDALCIYEKTEEVACIHGFMYDHKKELSETFFLKGADCWGWATWERAWKHFNPDAKYLLNEIKKRKLSKHFNFNNTYDYTGMLQLQIDNKISSWAIRWLASTYLDNMFCLYPNKTLVHNIGMDGSGTHCGVDTSYNNENSNTFNHVNVIWQEPKENKQAWKLFCNIFKKRNSTSFKELVIYKIKSIIPKGLKKYLKLLLNK